MFATKLRSKLLISQCGRVLRKRILLCSYSTNTIGKDEVRVRFAPSPTGLLHIGGVRTALFNYLFAKSHENGKFILRIEDTDQKRVDPESMEDINRSLELVGIVPDEGPAIGGDYGPYVQSERLSLYHKYANKLLESKHAYRCFCSGKHLKILKKSNEGKAGYDNRCRNLTPSEVAEKLEEGTPYTIRFALNDQVNSFEDILHGHTKHDVSNIEGDPIIMKADGYPTYHLANVIDDHYMKITHVIRGNEWLLSTCKHIMMYDALGWKHPKYAHLSLILNNNLSKMSKRTGVSFFSNFMDAGIHPTAILNFLAHHGAGFFEKTGLIYGDELSRQSVVIEEMAKNFVLERVGIQNCVFHESRVLEYNKKIMQHLLSTVEGIEHLTSIAKTMILKQYGEECLFHEVKCEKEINIYIGRILITHMLHINSIKGLLTPLHTYLWIRPDACLDSYDENHFKFLGDYAKIIAEKMKSHKVYHQDLAFQELRKMIKDKGFNVAEMMSFIRVLLTGAESGLGIGNLLYALGMDEVMARFNNAEKQFKARKQNLTDSN